MPRYDWLHQDITTPTRLALVADTRIGDVVSAPAHAELRSSAQVSALIARFRAGDIADLGTHKILIGIFTTESSGEVALASVECLDGHHRLIAGLAAGTWRVLGDVPLAWLDARVNGWPERGSAAEDRWVPYASAERAGLVKREVPEAEGARERTAAIDGAISARDQRFAPEDRGVSLAEVLSGLS